MLALFLVLTLLGVLLVESCVAGVTGPFVSKPSPEIAYVTITNTPFWVPPTHYDDDGTGKPTTMPGYWQPRGAIEIAVKNRLVPYIDENGKTVNIYYFVDAKLSSSDQWPFRPITGLPNEGSHFCGKSGSDYTLISFSYYPAGYRDSSGGIGVNSGGVSVDFRVQTVEGQYRPPSASDVGPHNEWAGIFPGLDGEGSSFVYFTLTIPSTDKPGVTRPNIKPTVVAPSASDPNNTPVSPSDFGPSNEPSTANPASQTPWASYIVAILITACIITIPLSIVVYLNKRRQKQDHLSSDKTLFYI
jgi:hypothetical protein